MTFFFFKETFTGPFKMASVNVYLLYQPMDEWNLVVRINHVIVSIKVLLHVGKLM